MERVSAARFLGVPPWDERLDDLYWIELAMDCQASENNARRHLEMRDGGK